MPDDEDMTLEEKLVLAIVQFSHERGTAYEIYKYPSNDDSGKYVLQFGVNEPSEPTANPKCPATLFQYAIHIVDGEMVSQRGVMQIEDKELYNHFLVFVKSCTGIDMQKVFF
ncbi:hypothetical protein KY349_01450 [Candidatus Woesearchaeota archaeon]|nr:hypothetical protein [Candidatus Woesearchaeota archaeon]